jgi:leucyl-tRNA synthetase
MHRFLGRLYRLVTRQAESTAAPSPKPQNEADRAVLRRLHQTIEKVTSDFESRWHFNTSLASIMELTNEIYARENDLSPAVMREVLLRLVLLMGPFAPYMVEELWRELGQQGPVLRAPWPEADPELARQDEVEVPVQVNGKLRSRLTVARGTSREDLERLATSDPKVSAHFNGKAIRKVVVVPDKLVNVVVG